LTGVEIKDRIISVASRERCGTVYEKVEEQGLGVQESHSALGGNGGLALSGGLSSFLFFFRRERALSVTMSSTMRLSWLLGRLSTPVRTRTQTCGKPCVVAVTTWVL
jgi:hypothetical protein